jgi:hypothetical protein
MTWRTRKKLGWVYLSHLPSSSSMAFLAGSIAKLWQQRKARRPRVSAVGKSGCCVGCADGSSYFSPALACMIVGGVFKVFQARSNPLHWPSLHDCNAAAGPRER